MAASHLGWGGVALGAQPSAQAAAVEQDIAIIEIRAPPGAEPSCSEWFNKEELSDITICADDNTAFACHRLLLVRWSRPLRRMLAGDMREAREARITLHGVDSEVLAAFLLFCYSCSCSIATEKLVALTALAEMYDVSLLQQLCMDAIRSAAPNQKACYVIYKAAKEVQQPDIQQLAYDHLASNIGSLVRQHSVFVELELEDVLLLCGRPGGGAEAAGGSDAATGAQQGGTTEPPAAGAVAPRRPELLLFQALMAWLAHKPAEREQHREQLLRQCVDLDSMSNVELSQVRYAPEVAGDDLLKNLLLDAYSRRCLATAQQPVYHMMQPLPSAHLGHALPLPRWLEPAVVEQRAALQPPLQPPEQGPREAGPRFAPAHVIMRHMMQQHIGQQHVHPRAVQQRAQLRPVGQQQEQQEQQEQQDMQQ